MSKIELYWKTYLWRPIESRLYILIEPLSKLTRRSEIDDFNGTAFRIAQKNVLGLEIAVNDAQLGRGQEHEGGAELLSELAR